MNMDKMIDYLKNRGFEAEKRYDSLSKAYRFKITKDGYHMVKYFEYPHSNDYVRIDFIQREFLEDFIREFEADYKIYSKLSQSYNCAYGLTNICISTPQITDVIFNNPATIVFWSDGTKTIVKAQDGEVFDREKGLAMAISKKTLGNEGNYYKAFDKWLASEEV